MQGYKAPQRETRFIMDELLAFPRHYEELGFSDATPDMVQAIFAEGARFTENVLAPLNRVGDEEGCHWNDGVVTTPSGFKEAYRQYVEGGWTGLAHPAEFAGQGLPQSLASAFSEWLSGANHAWAMYVGLSQGCMTTIRHHGTDAQKKRFLPGLIEGRWTGTMCLTEAHCGSDLGMLKTRAEPTADGSYRITGTKIFISAGEHDLAENIVHIVLARLPDAPAGTKGISLFVVPKVNVKEDGSLGERNAVNCGSIEHKMGIKGSATCVINFDGATGYLIGPPNRGLNCMFTFMNGARIGTGMEGLAAIEASYQGAIRYARERLQMRSLNGPQFPDLPADPLIVHPDVRRMLLTQKALAEGNRALALFCAKQLDISSHGRNESDRQAAENKLALLTPIVKAFLTETGVECTNLGMQVYGGHGYISEWGMEQLVRDTRICTLYEGTTGIQAIDLLARKVLGTKGELLSQFANGMRGSLASNIKDERFSHWCTSLNAHFDEWLALSAAIAKKAGQNPEEVGAASVDFLMYSGYVVVGYFWVRMAATAQQALDRGTTEKDFYEAKLHTARFYMERLLPRTRTLAATIESGSGNLMAIPADQFAL